MRSFISHLAGYLRRSWTYAVVDHGWFAAGLAVPLTVVLLTVIIRRHFGIDPEQQWQLAGMLFELAGIGIVAMGLRDIQHLFGRQPLRRAIREFIRAWPRWRQSANAVTEVSASATVSFGARASGDVLLPADATVEQQIAVLRDEIKNLNTAVFDNIHRINDRLEEHAKSLSAERHHREEQQLATRRLLDDAIAGGIALETIGLIWLVLGLILTTYSPELGRSVSTILQ